MGIKNREAIKKFETMKNEICGKIAALKEQKKLVEKEISVLEDSLKSLEQKIEKIQNSDLIVSEHAIIRYIERVIGINIEEIVEKIATEKMKKMVECCGNGLYPSENGEYKLKISNNVVVTIIKVN
jgi:hypothetical protein